MRSRTRRDALRLGAAALGSLAAGCLGVGGGQVPQESETTTRPSTTTAEPKFTLPQPQSGAAPDDPRPLAVNSEWPRYQFDASNTGHERGRTAVPEDPALYWQFYVRSTQPVVADGRLFTVETGPEERSVVCRDAATGRINWKVALDGGPTGSPTVTDRRVFVQSRRTLHALDRETGESVWQSDVGRGHPGSPVVVDDVVYCCSGARNSWPTTVFAVDAGTGDRRWAAELDGGVPGSLAAAGGTVFVATDAGTLHALGTVGGGAQWSVDLESPAVGTPLVAEGMVFVPTESQLRAYWVDDGQPRWSSRVGRVSGDAPAIAGDSVFVGTERGVHALKWATGREKWRYETAAPATTPTVGHEAVYAGEQGGETPAVVALGRGDGSEHWRYGTGALEAGKKRLAGVMGPPTPVAGGVYAVAADGMYALGPGS